MRLRRLAGDEYEIDDQNNGRRHEAAFTKIIAQKGTLDESLLLQESYAPGIKGKLIPRRERDQGADRVDAHRAARHPHAARCARCKKLIPGVHPKLPDDAQEHVRADLRPRRGAPPAS